MRNLNKSPLQDVDKFIAGKALRKTKNAIEKWATFQQRVQEENALSVRFINDVVKLLEGEYMGFELQTHYDDYRPSAWFIKDGFAVQFYVVLDIPSASLGIITDKYSDDEENDPNEEKQKIIAPIFLPFPMFKGKKFDNEEVAQYLKWFLSESLKYIEQATITEEEK